MHVFFASHFTNMHVRLLFQHAKQVLAEAHAPFALAASGAQVATRWALILRVARAPVATLHRQ